MLKARAAQQSSAKA